MSRLIAAALLAAALPSSILAASAQVPARAVAAARSEQILAVQVRLDRLRFSPGVVDGYAGGNTGRAILAFERARGLPADGRIDPGMLERLREAAPAPVLRRYTITPADVGGPFVERVPDDLAEKARLDRLSYTGPVEMLAERFHMAEPLLRALNPRADFARAGTVIVVAAVRDGDIAGEVARIEVDKRTSTLRAFDRADTLIATYPATIGSAQLPSPSGTTEVRAVAPDPAFYFDPEKLSWGPDRKLTVPPGPNNPVGSTWIDLAKPTYGIHGSPDPTLIAKTSSHGCVRLTNWDAEELARAVRPGTRVDFVG